MFNNPYANPYLMQQQRLQQYEQQYPQYAQQMPQVQPQGYRTMLVSNIDEANASQVTTDGQPAFYYNKGKGEIYLKQFDINTGGAIFQKFTLATMPVNENNDTKEKNIFFERFDLIESKLDMLASMFDEKPKKKKGDEQ